MIRPARNAPRASDNPALEVSHAVPNTVNMMVKRKSSLFLVLAILKSSAGIIHLAVTITNSMIPSPFRRKVTGLSPEVEGTPASMGVRSIMGTITISWNMSMPREILP